MLSLLKRIFSRRASRYRFKERDSWEPLTYATAERPTPSFLAWVAIWEEVLRSPNHQRTFDAAEILAILKENYGEFDGDWFIWERFVECIRLHCQLPFPHVRKDEKGSARMWIGYLRHNEPVVEYEGIFDIPADWSSIAVTVNPKKAEQAG